MGDILSVITSRRTVKYFEPKFVSWENIAKVIDAARHAPSSGNLQNWKFIVVLEPSLKEAIASACYEQYEIVQAGVLIVVCAEPEKAERYYGTQGQRFTIQNCAAAMQNMLLEAHSLGLGTRWIGAFDEGEVRLTLKVPDEVGVQAIIALGYAKDVPEKPPKYPLETIIYFHRWRNKIRDPAKYMNDIATILARKGTAAKEAIEKSGRFFMEKGKEGLAKLSKLSGKSEESEKNERSKKGEEKEEVEQEELP
ncbi:MAG: nitroreductase family protein [Nanoarchaeota archaeon]